MNSRLHDWQTQQKARQAARKRPLGHAPDFTEELALETTKAKEEAASLATLRARRLEVQNQLDAMPLRSEPLGRDRHGRTYVAMCGAPAANGLMVHIPLAAAAGGMDGTGVVAGAVGMSGLSEGGTWAWLEGVRSIRQLFSGLHPDGQREGPLLAALKKHRLSCVLHQALAISAGEEVLPLHPTSALTPAAAITTAATEAAAAHAAQQAAKAAAATAESANAAATKFNVRSATLVEPAGYASEPATLPGDTAAVAQRLGGLASAIACADEVADARLATAGKSTPTAAASSSSLSSMSKEARAEARAEAREAKAAAAEAAADGTAEAEVGVEVGEAGDIDPGEEGGEAGTPMPPPPPPLPSLVSAAIVMVAAEANELAALPPCCLPQFSLLR